MANATMADPDQYCRLIGPAKFAYAAVYIVHRLYKKFVNQRPGPEVTKLFFMLNSAEHEISTAQKN